MGVRQSVAASCMACGQVTESGERDLFGMAMLSLPSTTA